MEVVLLRHGKVDYPPIKIVSSSEFKRWVDAYNSNELDSDVLPANHALEMAQSANFVVCSDLPRSIESARYLDISAISLTSSLFQEAGLPIRVWNFPRLSVRIWAIFFRIAWLFGFSQDSESFVETKERAKKAASILIEQANKYERVLFIGHGIINRLIAKELRVLGWKGPKVPARKYWDYGVYQKKHNEYKYE